MRRLRRYLGIGTMLLVPVVHSTAATHITQLAPSLYAYISDNDLSCKSTFLVGRHGILVVDTGLNVTEGQKLLDDIRSVSTLPVEFIVNTHYHPDHQGGNGVVGPGAIVITSRFTRERTQQLTARSSQDPTGRGSAAQVAFRLATETVNDR